MNRFFLGKFAVITAIVLAVMAIAVACGDDDEEEATPTGGATTTAGNPAGATDVGVTATSIKVGDPTQLTGPVAPHGKIYAAGWESCYRRINDSGGINGRKIEWVQDDTAFDPTRAVAIATKLVTQDKVFAIVAAQESTFNAGAASYLEEQGVPNIGLDGLTTDQFEPSTAFPVGAKSVVVGHGMGAAAYDVGMRKIAIVNLQLPGELGPGFIEGIKTAFEAKGGQVLFTHEAPFGFTDQAAVLSRARAEGAEGIVGNLDIGNVTGFIEASRNLGWSPPKGWVWFGAFDFLEDLAKESDVAPKIYVVSGGFNTVWMENPTDEMKLFKETFEKYFPGTTPALFTYHAWTGCRLFEKLVTDLGDNVTRQRLVDAIKNLDNWDSGMGPVYSWKGNPNKNVNKGVATVALVDGKITQVLDWQLDPYLTD